MKGNQIFIPALATSPADLHTSWEIQKPLAEIGYRPGFMLVLLGGGAELRDTKRKQYENLREWKERYQDAPIAILLSNMPLEEIDFLEHRDLAIEHVRAGIEFTAGLPLGGRRILTFHINAWVSERQLLVRSHNEWRGLFARDIAPALQEIAAYGAMRRVEVKVETDPVPVFGDVPPTDTRTFREVKLRDLFNPLYFTGLWGFQEIRSTGLGICLDLCHNRTIYKAASDGEAHSILFPEDIPLLHQRTLGDDVRALEPSDLVHLNDGAGSYSRELGTVFREGVPLGEGDIGGLAEIVRSLDVRHIPYVLELNEGGDFTNRPSTKRSIEYLSAMTLADNTVM